jgi:hypothetical protein
MKLCEGSGILVLGFGWGWLSHHTADPLFLWGNKSFPRKIQQVKTILCIE